MIIKCHCDFLAGRLFTAVCDSLDQLITINSIHTRMISMNILQINYAHNQVINFSHFDYHSMLMLGERGSRPREHSDLARLQLHNHHTAQKNTAPSASHQAIYSGSTLD